MAVGLHLLAQCGNPAPEDAHPSTIPRRAFWSVSPARPPCLAPDKHEGNNAGQDESDGEGAKNPAGVNLHFKPAAGPVR